MTRRKMKGLILKGMNYMMALVFVLSALAVDSASWIPTILCGVSALWLLLATYIAEQKKIESEGDFDAVHSR